MPAEDELHLSMVTYIGTRVEDPTTVDEMQFSVQIAPTLPFIGSSIVQRSRGNRYVAVMRRYNI